jgi:hypothetical protein
MDVRLEIVADQVVCRQDGAAAFTASLTDFLAALADRTDSPPLLEAIPDGVRFVRRRGKVVVMVLEDAPQVRTVKWLTEDSSDPYGAAAEYRTVRLAFPFVVTVLAFRNGNLTGYQQCFFRTAPLGQLSDSLLLPNLYNVANGHGQQCWLCLANLQTDLGPLSWNEKVRQIRRHMWGASFNRSSEIHEGMSYWGAMRKVDRRVSTLETWEKATQEDPFFPLNVTWKPAGQTVGHVVEEMMNRLGAPPPATAAHLVQLLAVLAAPKRSAPSSRLFV